MNNLLWQETICEAAFSKLKEQLVSMSILAHYNVNLPLKLPCDASAYGVGAVISHVMTDGSERRTLSKSECNYSQIEKEALSIIFGVKKFYNFLLLYGSQTRCFNSRSTITHSNHSSCKTTTMGSAVVGILKWSSGALRSMEMQMDCPDYYLT